MPIVGTLQSFCAQIFEAASRFCGFVELDRLQNEQDVSVFGHLAKPLPPVTDSSGIEVLLEGFPIAPK